MRTLEKQRLIDEAELQSLATDKDHFLKCALSTYLKCLQIGDRHDLRVFRIMSLWFDNSNDAQVNKTMQVGSRHVSCALSINLLIWIKEVNLPFSKMFVEYYHSSILSMEFMNKSWEAGLLILHVLQYSNSLTWSFSV